MDTIIDKGAPAPYYGVLTPEGKYRFYQEKVRSSDLYEHRLNDLLSNPATAPNSPFTLPGEAAGFKWGFLTGSVLVLGTMFLIHH